MNQFMKRKIDNKTTHMSKYQMPTYKIDGAPTLDQYQTNTIN